MSPLFLIKYPDNQITIPGIFECWSGFGSTAMCNGPLMEFIIRDLMSRPEKTLFICQKADGHYKIPDEIITVVEKENAVLVAGVVAGKKQQPHFFYCPADDNFFIYNVYETFRQFHVPWEQRESILFWRGAVSGGNWRVDTVRKCLYIPKTDVKLIDKYVRPECNPQQNPELFSNIVEPIHQCKYKALLYLDGNSSASNVTWIFASGAVPVFVSIHEFWFRHLLVPWVHYVPIEWDLSDLEEKIQWIWDHDDEAKKIAENALEFARTVLCPESQAKFIRGEIDRLINEHKQNNQEEKSD